MRDKYTHWEGVVMHDNRPSKGSEGQCFGCSGSDSKACLCRCRILGRNQASLSFQTHLKARCFVRAARSSWNRSTCQMASLRPRWKFFDLQWTNERRDSSPIGLVELPQVLQVLHALLQHIHVQASSLKAAGPCFLKLACHQMHRGRLSKIGSLSLESSSRISFEDRDNPSSWFPSK